MADRLGGHQLFVDAPRRRLEATDGEEGEGPIEEEDGPGNLDPAQPQRGEVVIGRHENQQAGGRGPDKDAQIREADRAERPVADAAGVKDEQLQQHDPADRADDRRRVAPPEEKLTAGEVGCQVRQPEDDGEAARRDDRLARRRDRSEPDAEGRSGVSDERERHGTDRRPGVARLLVWLARSTRTRTAVGSDG